MISKNANTRLAFIMLIEIFQYGMQCTHVESEKERERKIISESASQSKSKRVKWTVK